MASISEFREVDFSCRKCGGSHFRVVCLHSSKDHRLVGWEIRCTACEVRYALHKDISVVTEASITELADCTENP